MALNPVPGPEPTVTQLLPFKRCWHFSWGSEEGGGTHFAQSDWKFEGKMARKQYYTTEEVLQEMAMDSDSDMEPAHDEILPDGDDLVAERSNEAVLNEPVPCLQVMVWEAEGMNMTWKTFVYKIPPWSLFCFCFVATFTTVHSITQKQTLEHTLSKCKSFITIYSETNTQCFSVTTLFVYKLLWAASSQHPTSSRAKQSNMGQRRM